LSFEDQITQLKNHLKTNSWETMANVSPILISYTQTLAHELYHAQIESDPKYINYQSIL